jgi:hypothetical protein
LIVEIHEAVPQTSSLELVRAMSASAVHSANRPKAHRTAVLIVRGRRKSRAGSLRLMGRRVLLGSPGQQAMESPSNAANHEVVRARVAMRAVPNVVRAARMREGPNGLDAISTVARLLVPSRSVPSAVTAMHVNQELGRSARRSAASMPRKGTVQGIDSGPPVIDRKAASEAESLIVDHRVVTATSRLVRRVGKASSSLEHRGAKVELKAVHLIVRAEVAHRAVKAVSRAVHVVKADSPAAPHVASPTSKDALQRSRAEIGRSGSSNPASELESSRSLLSKRSRSRRSRVTAPSGRGETSRPDD